MKNFLLFWPPIMLAILSLLFKNQFDAQVKIIFLFTWMMTWWIAELLPMGTVALLPIVYLPFSEVLPLKKVVTAYSDPILFLFLGGFVLARALEKTRLSERMALALLRLTGKSTFGVQVAFLITSAFLSMWISNTATTMMMIPIALAVIHQIREYEINADNPDKEKTIRNFQTGLMLILSYSASLGGLMTPIGTPPNLVFLGILKQLNGTEIDFLTWMIATIPVGICSLIALLLVIKYGPLKSHIPFSPALIKSIYQVGNHKTHLLPEQKVTLGIFGSVVFLWIFKSPLNQFIGINFFDDQITAILGAILLFGFPFRNHLTKKVQNVLQSSDVNQLPWDVFLLFGGSMALASGVEEVGILGLLMKQFQQMPSLSFALIALILIVVTVLLTEVMSNVALAAVSLPLIIGLAKSQNYSAEALGLMVTLATSFGFSLPMSTPPNAIVFGTGHVRFRQMLSNGWIMNILTTLILLFFATTWWKLIF